MRLQDIMDTLSKHREHYRVLPERARVEINGLLVRLAEVIDEENNRVVVDGIGKNTTDDPRPKRKRVGKRVSKKSVE
jgi:hypothetical protein